jgi:hypothetical protein
MPLPVIADVHRVALEWTTTTVAKPAVNVFNMHFVGDPAALFAVIDSHVTRAMWSCVTDQNFVDNVVITPLDGASAGQIFSTGGATKWTGLAAGEPIPQASCLLTLGTGLRGPRHRGRLYLPYLSESAQTSGQINAGVRANTDAAWLAFYTACLADLAVLGVASYKHADFHAAAYILTRQYSGTQRRRQRRG